MPKSEQRCRYWCWTLNNYEGEFKDSIQQLVSGGYAIHVAYQPELGESGTKHLQGVVGFTNARTLLGVKRVFSFVGNPHLEAMRGSYDQALTYCKKEETRDTSADFGFTEHGEVPLGAGKGQGNRSDLEEVAVLAAGGSDLVAIAGLHGADFIRYHSGIRALVSLHEPRRNWPTEVYWFWGPTGTGKTRAAFATAPDAYFKNPTTKWWDGYNRHEDVIIDDFRADFSTFASLLRLTDRYPMEFEVKGGTCQCVIKRLFITTPKDPANTWTGRTEEDLAQLERRIKEVRYFPPLAVDFVPAN